MYKIGVRSIFCGSYQDTNGTVSYSGGKKIADAINIKITQSGASIKKYAGDKLNDNLKRFISGSVTIKQDDISDEDRILLFGHQQQPAGLSESADLQETVFNETDEGCFIGMGFYAPVRRNCTDKFKAIFLRKVKFSDTDSEEEYATQEESVTMTDEEFKGDYFLDATGNYKNQIITETEEQAVDWLKKKLNITTSA